MTQQNELLMAPEDESMGIDEQSMPTLAMEMAPEYEPEAVALPVMQILPSDFRLPILTRFVPDLRIKERIDKALAYVQTIVIDGKGPEGIAAADAGLSELNAAIAAGEAHFKDPAEIAYDLHKHVTSTRGDWINNPKAVAKATGTAIWRESERLKEEAERERRRLQEEANRKMREEAAAEAARAAKNNAPAPVVQKLEERAKTAVAPPVAPPAAPPPLVDNSVVTSFKARLDSTPEDADDFHRDITALSDAEFGDVTKFLKAILDGRKDLLALLSLKWGELDRLASSQEKTFNVPGFVAFKTGGTRKKPGKKVR